MVCFSHFVFFPPPRFINHVYTAARYSSECNIISLIYVNRLTSSGKMPLTMNNWRGIWISAIVLAQKVWDDNPLKTSSFVNILPNVSKEQLRDLERRALALIEFVTGVKPSLYAKYYFELRQLFTDITGPDSNRYDWKLKPLTVIGSKKLEEVSKKEFYTNKEKPRGGTNSSHTNSKLNNTPVNRLPQTPTHAPGSSRSTSTSSSSMFKSPKPKNTNYTYEDVTRVDTSRFVLS